MILLRHGQSEFNVVYGETRQDPGIRDPRLTALGHEQAAAAAQSLADESMRFIVSSPYTRALQTAHIVAEALGLPHHVDPGIGERVVFHADIGSPRSELAPQWPHLELDHLSEQWWPDPEETVPALLLRCQNFRIGMRLRRDWHQAIVVSHWGFIRGLTGEEVGNCGTVRFDPTA
jgi:broad specificity phosphatase PhoE